MNNNFTVDENQLMISQELLHFLYWVSAKEPLLLKKIVQHALKSGLGEALKKKRSTFEELELQESVVNFFELIEQYLYQALSEEKEVMEVPDSLSQTIEYLDAESYDSATIALSIARTNKALRRKITTPSRDSEPNAKEELCKELLKNWHPRNKQLCH